MSTTRQIPLRYQTKAEAHIEDLITKGRLTKVTEPYSCFCHSFFVPKPVGKIDLVTDLSPVNRNIQSSPLTCQRIPNIPNTACYFPTINIEQGKTDPSQ